MIKEIVYLGREHGSMEQEWLAHEKSNEWWYATGTLNDDQNNFYSYQIVLIKTILGPINAWSTQLALTDFNNKKHYFYEKQQPDGSDITISDTEAIKPGILEIRKNDEGFNFIAKSDEFSFKINTKYGKGGFWHCDEGYLIMGKPELGSTTYYSFPSMPTSGVLEVENKKIKVTGQSWFDKQGGVYDSLNPYAQWEWFSFRFNDNDQIMLFSFPQDNYYDGTLITDTATRLNNYKITPHREVTVDGMKFSSGWDIELPGIKEGFYRLEPIMEGQRNGAYYEQVSNIFTKDGKNVGKCVVELLPGVLNPERKSNWKDNFK